MNTLTVLFDATCGFCVRCRYWLQTQPQLVRLEFVAAGSLEAQRRFPGLAETGTPEDLVVVSDEGGVYHGDRAFLMCLWALEDYREWSLRLAHPGMIGLARRAFELVSSHRRDLSRWLALAAEEEIAGSPPCGEPHCRPR
jgi:predicted DCC family thiol-disulfide oxidoreductase YuxK